jgi:predicted PurR-regulated permease PerM
MINRTDIMISDDSDPGDESMCKGYSTKIRIRSLVSIFLWGVVLLLAFRFFAAVKFVVLTAIGAAILAAALKPLVDHLRGPLQLRALLMIVLLLLVVSLVLFTAGWLLYEPIVTNVEQLPDIRKRANDGLEDMKQSLGLNGQLDVEEISEIASQILTGGTFSEWLSDIAGSVLTTLLALLLIIIGAAYLLARPAGSLTKPALKILPPDRQEPTMRSLRSLPMQFRWWLIGTLFSMIVIGFIFGLGYWVIGLAFALPLALFAGLAQMVPTYGPMITLFLSLMIAATQGIPHIIGVSIIYLIAQTLESYLLTPLVMNKAVHIPPIITLFTIILWGNILGPAGLILAIPLDLTIWAFIREHLIRFHQAQRTVQQPE